MQKVVGSFDFNLSPKGELLRLFEPFGTLVDYVEYGDKAPWPTKADGMVRVGKLLRNIYIIKYILNKICFINNNKRMNWRKKGTPARRQGSVDGLQGTTKKAPALAPRWLGSIVVGWWSDTDLLLLLLL